MDQVVCILPNNLKETKQSKKQNKKQKNKNKKQTNKTKKKQTNKQKNALNYTSQKRKKKLPRVSPGSFEIINLYLLLFWYVHVPPLNGICIFLKNELNFPQKLLK